MKANRESRLPIVHSPYKARKTGLDMRIADTLYNGAIQLREKCRPREICPIEGANQLFGHYRESMKKRDLLFDAKEIVFSSVQKTLEASIEQRVVEVEKEEAIEHVLHSLKLLHRNHHPELVL